MSPTLSPSQFERFRHQARELQRQVHEMRAAMMEALGENHAVTLKAEEVGASVQRLEWALERSVADNSPLASAAAAG